jgi:hypothetical protein
VFLDEAEVIPGRGITLLGVIGAFVLITDEAELIRGKVTFELFDITSCVSNISMTR